MEETKNWPHDEVSKNLDNVVSQNNVFHSFFNFFFFFFSFFEILYIWPFELVLFCLISLSSWFYLQLNRKPTIFDKEE